MNGRHKQQQVPSLSLASPPTESTMSDFSPAVRLDWVFSFKPHLTFFVRKQKRNEIWFVQTNVELIHNRKISHSFVYRLKELIYHKLSPDLKVRR